MALGYGAQKYDPESRQLLFDAPENIEGTQFGADLTNVHRVLVNDQLAAGVASGADDPQLAAWKSGKIAIIDMCGCDLQSWGADNPFEWDVAPWPKGPHGRFNPLTTNYLGVWNFSKNKPAAMSLLHHLSLRDSASKMIAASQGFDLATFTSFADLPTWAEQGPPKGSIKHYPNAGDQRYSMAAEPAPAAIAQQIYSQALMPRMVGRMTQGGDSVDVVIDWAARELEGYMRT